MRKKVVLMISFVLVFVSFGSCFAIAEGQSSEQVELENQKNDA